MKKKKLFRCQKGASAVEFALVLPLLLVFVFGIIEFGIMLYDKAIITNASREGARVAIRAFWADTDSNGTGDTAAPYPADDVKTVAENYAATRLIKFSSAVPVATVGAVTAGAAGINYRTVTVTYGHSFLVFPNVLGTLLGVNSVTMPGTIPLTASSTMRMESQLAALVGQGAG
jgi:Flp pilus assembly protein TadG